MPELSSSTYSETDGSNNSTSPNGWPEGMDPSGVNDSDRAGMGALKRFWDRIQGKFASTGSANAYVLTPDVALAAYVTGERYSFRANFTCTGTSTLNISALGAKTIKKFAGSTAEALASGDIQNGQSVTVEYDGTDLLMVTPLGNAGGGGSVTSVATGVGLTGGPITGSGTIDFDVNNITAETVPAVDDEVAIYDITASAHRKMRIDDMLEVINVLTADTAPDGGADFLVTYDATATAVRKVLPDNLLKIINGLTEDASPDLAADFVVTYDASASVAKKVQLNNLGALGAPDFTSSEQTVTLDTVLDVAHSLGAVPALFQVVLRCKTAQEGYAVGDEMIMASYTGTAVDRGVTVASDATNVTITTGDQIEFVSQSTKNLALITAASWKWVVRAWS